MERVVQRKRQLGLERLESRIVLAGNVSATVRGGNLQVTGDTLGNEITIEQPALNRFTITSRDGTTTINGQAGPLTFNGVKKNLSISLSSGDDVVELAGSGNSSLRVSNRLNISTGSGNDQVLMNHVHAIGLHIDLGTQDDLLNVGDDGGQDGLMITKEAVIGAGSGRDDVRIANTLFKRALTLDMGSGNDQTTLQDTTVKKSSTVVGGGNRDTLSRQNNHGKLKYTGFEIINNTVTSPSAVSPVANNDTASVTRNSTTTITVLANDTSAASTINPATVTITQAPTNGTANVNSNGTITYTNTGGAATSDLLKYSVKDQLGTTSNVATVAITVNSATFAATNDTATITEDATPAMATGNVLTNDIGGTGTKTVSAVNGAAGSVGTDVAGQFGTFHINSDGSYTYTLNNSNATVNALNNGSTLTDSMAYTSSAGGQTSTATLTVTIQGHTDLVAVDDPASITEDAASNITTGNVLTNDTGGNGTKTITAVSGLAANVAQTINGQFGTFNIAASGSFTYTLNNSNTTVNALDNGQTLTDSIDYTASDGITTDIGTLTITIQGATDGP
jgi:VCBS repeat-containing protein